MTRYSGDVVLTGDEEPPTKIVDPENVHVKTGAINGNLKILNAAYVFTNTPAGGSVKPADADTIIQGTIEDAYIERDGVTGDVVIEDAEDVFIEHGAVTGELQIIGDEQRFFDESTRDPATRTQYDRTITGWQRSVTVDNPEIGVRITGGRSHADITNSINDFEVYITGWNNSVRVDGRLNTVTLHFIGSENTVTTSAYTDVTIATDSGIDNDVEIDTFPVDDLIQTTKEEAYSGVWFGRTKTTYQTPVVNEEYCPSCGANADAIIKRHQEDVFVFLGIPVYTFESGSKAHECEECSMNAQPDVQLTEDERKEILR